MQSTVGPYSVPSSHHRRTKHLAFRTQRQIMHGLETLLDKGKCLYVSLEVNPGKVAIGISKNKDPPGGTNALNSDGRNFEKPLFVNVILELLS